MRADETHGRRFVVAILALLLLGAEKNCNPDREMTAAPVRRYVIFIDLTLSLSDTQTSALEKVLAQIVPNIPPGSRVVAYPISERVIAAGPLFEKTVPVAENVIERKNARAEMSKLESELLQAVENMRATLGKGTALQYTCISDALRQAAKDARQFQISARTGLDELEIIVISDMLEDCEASLLGRPVDLEKPDIALETALARALPADSPLVDLQGARVTMLLPSLALAQPKTRRPPEHELEAFWRAILNRCNDDPRAFSFGTSIPDRLKKPMPMMVR